MIKTNLKKNSGSQNRKNAAKKKAKEQEAKKKNQKIQSYFPLKTNIVSI